MQSYKNQAKNAPTRAELLSAMLEKGREVVRIAQEYQDAMRAYNEYGSHHATGIDRRIIEKEMNMN